VPSVLCLLEPMVLSWGRKTKKMKGENNSEENQNKTKKGLQIEFLGRKSKEIKGHFQKPIFNTVSDYR
jgi:hypothetical protein